MTDLHDTHAHRDPDLPEEPLDAANQSLSDALRASFSILKGIMLILIVLYCFSNVGGLGSHEQALVLRLGKLLPEVREAGLVWAFPFPIDEVVRLPTRKSNVVSIDSHTFQRHGDEVGKSLSFITRSPHSGLDPSYDGALLTGDTGLVHVQWKVEYKIDDVQKYVTEMAGRNVEAAERLIRSLIENVGIEIASELTAEEMIRTQVDEVQNEMQRRVNQRLRDLESGILVSKVDMFEPTPPLQVRAAFDRTQKAENEKKKRISNAEQQASKLLSGAAGAAYQTLVDALDAAEADPSEENRAALEARLPMAEGRAGEMMKTAGAYASVVVGRMESDVAQYKSLLPEYVRNPEVLIERLWEETRLRIFENPQVTKLYRPSRLQEFRLVITLDPELQRQQEQQRAREQKFDASKLRQAPLHPVGPEYD